MKKFLFSILTTAIIFSCDSNPLKGKVFKSDMDYTIVFNSNGSASVSVGGNAATYNVFINGISVELIHPYSDSRLSAKLSSDGNSLILEQGSITFYKQ